MCQIAYTTRTEIWRLCNEIVGRLVCSLSQNWAAHDHISAYMTTLLDQAIQLDSWATSTRRRFVRSWYSSLCAVIVSVPGCNRLLMAVALSQQMIWSLPLGNCRRIVEYNTETCIQFSLASKRSLTYLVSRSGLWLYLRKFGCTEKFTKILKSLHEGMLGRVNIGGEFSEPFPVTNGVKQGCITGPIIFN